MKKQLTLLALVVATFTQAQNIGINSTGALPNASAVLDVDAAPANNKGMLVPRLALVATNNASPVTSPANSLLVYNTATASSGLTAVAPGYYYWDGTKWVRMQTSATIAADWNLLGNSGTNAATNFVGTTDNVDLTIRTNNTEKMRVLSNGNVGIGTTAPAFRLDVTGVGQFSGGTQIGAGIQQGYYGDGTHLALKAYNSASSDIYFQTWNSAATNMVIKNNGNVGIGTAAPVAPAILELNATNKGFLMPRIALLSNVDAVTVPSPVTGLQVYNTNFTSTLSRGICYWDGTKWLNVSTFIPAGSGYFAQQFGFNVPNNTPTTYYTIPFGTITAPESGVYQANIRTFAVPFVAGGVTGSIPLDQTAFYYAVFVNNVMVEEVEFYCYRTQVIATASTLRYSATVGQTVEFKYRVAVGYTLDFSSVPGYFQRNNVVISKVQ